MEFLQKVNPCKIVGNMVVLRNFVSEFYSKSLYLMFSNFIHQLNLNYYYLAAVENYV